MSRTVIHIVPQLPPPPEGVGSFALSLAGALVARGGIESRFVVAAPSWIPGSTAGAICAVKIPRSEPAALCETLEAFAAGAETTLLLHYANYGYEPRGCPSWLAEGLAKWKTRTRGRLVTAFHEIHAMGPPWRSSFWLSWRQLAVTIARLSEGLVTSMRLYRRILLQGVPDREIAVLPVFSPVGEPSSVLPLSARTRRLVVFGGPGARARAYRDLKKELEFACRYLGIEEVCDVGPGDGPLVWDLPVHLRRFGSLPAAEVGELLADSLAGFIAYPAPFLPKSSIFAAYCAHGVLPVCAWPWPRRQVEPLPPFWRPRPGTDADSDRLQHLADQAHTWYGGHALNRHAAHYQSLIFP